ncbi:MULTISPECIES: hypothetical protein [unclassified Aureimonas]|uniref:AbiU2 domain-containing protein n=1 Tax=unclassified Aureimonas TaxID=2615206 RepID=UPI0007110B8D|nr:MULTISPECIES: hypothetical protein [unclassified Aureimonas]KQT60370.1 hypothetical protein ASG62_06850 [Aureimonas sp. Leaf427]
MVDLARALVAMHASNEIVLYSTTLTAQIPRSHAGHAFRQFQRSMYLFELIRLAAMWDGYGSDRESIPTVVKLIDDRAVIEAVLNRMREREAQPPHLHIVGEEDLDPATAQEIRELFGHGQKRISEERVEAARAGMQRAIQRCREIAASAKVEALRDLRDRAIAHNLDLPEPAEGEETESDRWRYGGETDLLSETIELVEELNKAINSTSFDWDEAKGQSRRNAEELWTNCQFSIPSRS